jgi:hypothetical protein
MNWRWRAAATFGLDTLSPILWVDHRQSIMHIEFEYCDGAMQNENTHNWEKTLSLERSVQRRVVRSVRWSALLAVK